MTMNYQQIQNQLNQLQQSNQQRQKQQSTLNLSQSGQISQSQPLIQQHHNHQKDPNKYKYQQEISSMMFTFGEVRHSLSETTQMVEDITKAQITEMLSQAAAIARRKAARFISHEDLIFLIRRDKMKVSRLSAYLSWRKVRKIANRTNEDDDYDSDKEEGKKVKRQKIKLSWNLMDSLVDEDLLLADSESEDEGGDDDEFTQEAMQRLKYADQVTQAMSSAEYMDYAECRQASFTYKKPSRFREWLNVEAVTSGMRPSNDILDILGFICYEMVRTLTEQSLAVKFEMELAQNSKTDGSSNNDIKNIFSHDRHVGSNKVLTDIVQEVRESYKPYSIFTCPNDKTPIEPLHVYEAYRRLQCNDTAIIPSGGSWFAFDSMSVRNNSFNALRLFQGGSIKGQKRSLI